MSESTISTFLAERFVALGKYQELQKQLAEKDAELTHIVKALGEAVQRRNAAEAILNQLKYKRHDSGVWVNTEL